MQPGLDPTAPERLEHQVPDQVSSVRWRLADLVLLGFLLVSIGFLLGYLGMLIEANGYDQMGIDYRHYQDVARSLLHGSIPYREVFFEYPPMAIVPVVLPAIVAPEGAPALFGTLLILENALVVSATAVCLYWLARRGWSARTPLATVLCYGTLVLATPVLFWRFDAVPALVSVVALCAFAVRKFAWSGVALGLGGLLKLYPLALALVFALETAVDRSINNFVKLTVGVLLTVALGITVTFLAAGSAGWSFLAYNADRGVELDSIPASIALVAHVFAGTPASTFQAFGSWQLRSPLTDTTWIWLLFAGLLLTVLVMSTWTSFSHESAGTGVRPQTVVASATATIVLVLLAYRVLSPQYLVWLIPFGAMLPRRKWILTLAVATLSLLLFPFVYGGLVRLVPLAIAVLALRNGLLFVLFIWLVAPGVSIFLRRPGLRAFAKSRSEVTA